MNEKHAREARIINRIVGKLVLRTYPEDGTTHNVRKLGPYKLARNVKAMWESLPHAVRGTTAKVWRGHVAAGLIAKGVELAGQRTKRRRARTNDQAEGIVIDARQAFRQMSRSKRNVVKRISNRIAHGMDPGERLPPELFQALKS
jgi:hypothetical protein